MVVLLGDAIPPPSPFTQDSTQVFAHGAPGDIRTKHICWSNAKVGRQKLKGKQWSPPSRWEPVFWDSSGSVTPLSLLFGAIQSTQQLSLSLLNVTMGQVNFHNMGQKRLSIFRCPQWTWIRWTQEVECKSCLILIQSKFFNSAWDSLTLSSEFKVAFVCPCDCPCFVHKIHLKTWIQKSSHKLSFE